MTETLVDTNVMLDVAGDDPIWGEWSERALARAVDDGGLVMNQIVYAELAGGYLRREQLDEALKAWPFQREDVPWDAAFMAGLAFVNYRRRGGARTSTLPDFFIGAHAAARGYRLLTRDRGHYASYFPTLDIVSPERQP
ncbi:DNA-binding protein [Kaistia algarum]|uniref:type II toxin-antitoxin system VapC family toxin n=1 Tax=Kaistia algarum TaxID=2083279 RepID=UPI000CE7A918|nr:type II toxin-antitoxin system VapC family toxin [Kaistia algarum]MCX5516353.1 type II toxin-antitoxin system VapC family toxin [Kaistia algarum]PPE78730.1 DNA-binding protein [Kaistia algarum]